MGRKVPQVTAAEVQAVRALAARLDPEDKKALLREIDKELTQRATTAHHEAGHAVVAVVQGLRFRQINITGNYSGRHHHDATYGIILPPPQVKEKKI